MKTKIGIIGVGFVGTAVAHGMCHAFDIVWFDKYKKTTLDIPNSIRTDSIEQLSSLLDGGPIFVCLPTPMKESGKCDIDIIENVLYEIEEAGSLTVIIKSTVPPGTTEYFNKKFGRVTCVFNPEFLREATFIEDFKNQDHIIIGGPHAAAAKVKDMYQIAYPHVPTTKTSSTIAEMIKYVKNCFLATKVSFANEMYQICQKLEIDWDKVVEYATKDERLGTSHWAVPGPDGKIAWGGKCFPKDLNALIYLAKELDIDPKVMQAAWEKNLELRPDRDWEQIVGVIS